MNKLRLWYAYVKSFSVFFPFLWMKGRASTYLYMRSRTDRVKVSLLLNRSYTSEGKYHNGASTNQFERTRVP